MYFVDSLFNSFIISSFDDKVLSHRWQVPKVCHVERVVEVPQVQVQEATRLEVYGYGSIPINTIFRGMNIHLPAILMLTRGTRFWHTAIWKFPKSWVYPHKSSESLDHKSAPKTYGLKGSTILRNHHVTVISGGIMGIYIYIYMMVIRILIRVYWWYWEYGDSTMKEHGGMIDGVILGIWRTYHIYIYIYTHIYIYING